MKKTVSLVLAVILVIGLTACAQSATPTTSTSELNKIPGTTLSSVAPTTQSKPTTLPIPSTQPTPSTQPAPSTQPSPSTVPGTSAPKPDPYVFPAPDFTVYDAEGNPVKLSDFLGKPVVLNFWASWCPPCKAEMPDFQAEFEVQGQTVQFLFVNLTDGSRETVETASGYIAQQGYTFPVFYDKDYSAAFAYGIRSIPSTFFIDANGNLIAQATGAIDRETLQLGISMILGNA